MNNKLKAASTSIIVNVLLLISKATLALITGSIGLLAESAHSLFDLFASFLAYLGIKKADQPEDLDHHYGHEKFETLSSFLQALLITGTACIVMYEAYHKILNPSPVENSEWGIILMIISIPVTYFTAKYLSKIAGEEGGSHALEADSAHFTTDVLSSIAVLIGLIFVKFGFLYGDPIAAFIVGIVMIYISIELGLRSYRVFMDASPDVVKMKKMIKVLDHAVKTKKITRYHKLKARMTGSKILLEVHIHVPNKLSIVKAHQISTDIRKDLKKVVPEIKDVTIHEEPDKEYSKPI